MLIRRPGKLLQFAAQAGNLSLQVGDIVTVFPARLFNSLAEIPGPDQRYKSGNWGRNQQAANQGNQEFHARIPFTGKSMNDYWKNGGNGDSCNQLRKNIPERRSVRVRAKTHVSMTRQYNQSERYRAMIATLNWTTEMSEADSYNIAETQALSN